MSWQQIVKFMKKITDVTLVRHLMNTVPSAQKHKNTIYVFNEQLFVNVLSKNIA